MLSSQFYRRLGLHKTRAGDGKSCVFESSKHNSTSRDSSTTPIKCLNLSKVVALVLQKCTGIETCLTHTNSKLTCTDARKRSHRHENY